jgi:hypothetical protein
MQFDPRDATSLESRGDRHGSNVGGKLPATPIPVREANAE